MKYRRMPSKGERTHLLDGSSRVDRVGCEHSVETWAVGEAYMLMNHRCHYSSYSYRRRRRFPSRYDGHIDCFRHIVRLPLLLVHPQDDDALKMDVAVHLHYRYWLEGVFDHDMMTVRLHEHRYGMKIWEHHGIRGGLEVGRSKIGRVAGV